MEFSTKRRTSFSFLFGSQKPTLITQQNQLAHNQPTRDLEFVDSPSIYQPSSPLIDRPKIPTDLEAQLRNACSLLVSRNPKGQPSGPSKRSRAVTTNTTMHEPSTAPQIDSMYVFPKVGAEVAALKDKYDSGVVLTQQSSMQAMRVLRSQTSQHLKCDSLESGRATSSHSALASDGTQSSSAPPSRAGYGSQAMGPGKESRDRSQRVKAFLDGSESEPHPDGDGNHVDAVSEDDVEVFLDPETTLMSTGVPSFHSPHSVPSNITPGLGKPVEPSSNNDGGVAESEAPIVHPPEYTDPLDLGSTVEASKQHPGIIIDSSGLAHVLTAAEETERDMNIQQAVMAKMRTGTIANASTPHLPVCTESTDNVSNLRPGSNASRLKTSWSTMSKATSRKLRSRGTEDVPTNEKTVFRRLRNLFSKRKPVNVVPPVGTY
ncbi:uncharacterized protein BO88DRAFT_178554 [Aspergillus vadensis CBS 113365]|uniref:Uncharacterized protein n=1 Tax=Aspergillus vadensis (strain CBS 113365 / IMI 142717 / IBT 24658) TaxID=1448311 RepID=A0A319AXE0_ASPVC|nr:hypothetical protein BO88DRAFT_178554 [Aspergillus vadensis CBS 113365]PYH64415.1 hypothetical protein BO88DRAFT_178554 [Aspergillus vadensis CBS 113365]